MIRFDIHEDGSLLRAYRAAFLDVSATDYESAADCVRRIGQENDCRIVGYLDGNGHTWITEAIEFPDEESLTMFLLRWA